MKVSVDRLRWGLAAAVVLLLGGLAALVGYGRYSAARKWADILRKNGITISHDTDNVTWSQAVKGHTVYTLRAKKAVQIADGKYTLHGVTILFYGKNSNSVDRVQGDEFQYDQKTGVAKADGEVHIDLQAPGALTHDKRQASSQPAGTSATVDLDHDKNVIHVLTSGLVYLQKLGVAATDRHVEFHYGGITCVSQGAEFDTNGNALHLLADVVMSGDLHGAPAVVHARRADLDRAKNTVAVLQPVVNSQGESAKADNALLLLQSDGSLQHASAWGSVLLATASRHMTAQRLEAVFAAQNAPQSAVLSGGVTLDGDAAKPMHGTASEAHFAFTPAGAVSGVVAKGAVRLAGSVLRPRWPPLAREMRGETVTARFQPVPNSKQMSLQDVHAVGQAMASGQSFSTGAKTGSGSPAGVATSGIVTTQIAANDLLAEFVPIGSKAKQPGLRHLMGQGRTRLQQDGLNGAQEVSSGDTLDATFAADSRPGVATGSNEVLRLQSAVQSGHVQIRDQAAAQGAKPGPLSIGRGDRASFDGMTDRLTLTGNAAYQQEGTSLNADALTVEQGTGNAEAQGNVEAALASPDQDTTHVLADHARLIRASQTAEFFGTDAHPARIWQGGSQITAANLFLDDVHQSLAAKPAAPKGMVEAVFVPDVRAPGPQPTSNAPRTKGSGKNGLSDTVHVSTPALNYSGLRHEAVCTGGVRMRQGDVQIHAQQAVMFLSDTSSGSKLYAGKTTAAKSIASPVSSPAELGGSLERMVFSGNVRLDEPGRAGDGEQLVYTAKDAAYVLTGTPGKPPRVADAEQGMVTGPALLFRGGEKSVIVDGPTASNGSTGHEPPGRVHTDVNVRPRGR